MDLSVVIVTYKSRSTIEECLRSLLANLGGLETEVWLVDNNSNDDTPRLVAQAFPAVNLMENPTNSGFAGGCNLAIKRCAGRHILLLNPDTLTQPETLPALVKFLDEHSLAGIAGCVHYTENGAFALSCYPDLSLATIFWSHLQLNKIFPNIVQGVYRKKAQNKQGLPFQVSWVAGSCFMFKRELVQEIGLLDDNIFLFAEEPDYCLRARRKGWQTWFLPGCSVIHYEGKSTNQVPFIRLSNYYICKLYFFNKFYSASQFYLLKLVFTFDLLARSSVRAVQHIRPGKISRRPIKFYLKILGLVWKYTRKKHFDIQKEIQSFGQKR
jgi:GT2 family glycosyltransferase